MVMVNTTRPVVITGGKFFVLDYDKAKAVSEARVPFLEVD